MLKRWSATMVSKATTGKLDIFVDSRQTKPLFLSPLACALMMFFEMNPCEDMWMSMARTVVDVRALLVAQNSKKGFVCFLGENLKAQWFIIIFLFRWTYLYCGQVLHF